MADRTIDRHHDAHDVRTRPVFFGLRQIVWLLTPKGAVERFNPFWTEYTGLPDQIEGLAWAEVFHPEDRQYLVNARTLGVASEQSYEVEARMRRADGIFRRHLCRVSPLRDGGELIGWLGTAIDVEDVRAAEDAARESERRKRKVLESISEGYYRLDRAFRFVEVNAAFERMTGKRRAEVVGENLWTIFPDAPRLAAYTKIPLGSASTEERWSGAAKRWVEVSIYRSPDGFEAYFRDVTDRRRAAVWQRSISRITEGLHGVIDSVDITTLAAEVVGEALGLVRAGYVYVDGQDEARIERDWVSSPRQRRSAGRYRISDWGTFLLSLTGGESVVVDNVETDPRTMSAAEGWRNWNVRALLFMPLATFNRLNGYLLLHDDKPRVWAEDELLFVRTVSDLVWAALCRRQSGTA